MRSEHCWLWCDRFKMSRCSTKSRCNHFDGTSLMKLFIHRNINSSRFLFQIFLFHLPSQTIVSQSCSAGSRCPSTTMKLRTRCTVHCCVHAIYRRWIRKAFRIHSVKSTSSQPRTLCDIRDGKSRESLTRQTIPSLTKPSRSWGCHSKTWHRRRCL